MSRKDDEHLDESDQERLAQRVVEGLTTVASMEAQHNVEMDSVRRSMEEAQAAAAAGTGGVAAGRVCNHGGMDPSATPTESMNIFRTIHLYLKACEVQEEHLEYDAFVGFWMMHSRDPAFSMQGVACLKGMATSSVLESLESTPNLSRQRMMEAAGSSGPFNDARMYLAIATKMEAALHWPSQAQGDGDDDASEPALLRWSRAVNFSRESLEERGESPALREYYQAVTSICSNQGLVDFLAQQSMCDCLENHDRRHDTICDTCFQGQHEDKKIFKCGRCQVARYCSQQCQKKDWKKKYHKRYCKKYLHLKSKLEKMDAKSR